MTQGIQSDKKFLDTCGHKSDGQNAFRYELQRACIKGMESEEKNIYEKKNHHCGGSHRRYFGSSCDYFNFGTDADADLTSGR